MTEPQIKRVILEERQAGGKRLGRHVEHDPRSRSFAFGIGIAPLVSVTHPRHGGIFDQGNLGSCTGNAAAGALNTEPIFLPHHSHVQHEKQAVEFYKLATTLDGIPGSYPPDDTGSSGLAVAKAIASRGLIRAYHWAFGIDEALAALQVAPVITGVNWYESFDTPDPDGVVRIAGQVRGGHEFVVRSYKQDMQDPLNSIIGADNSWGRTYGRLGHFYFSVRTWAQLLQEQGDVTVLVG